MATAATITATRNSIMELPRFRAEQYHGFSNLAEAFFFNSSRNGDLTAYDQAIAARDDRPRRYLSTSYSESETRVLKIAAQLLAWGVRPGDKVAVLSLNRPEWTEAEMAIYALRAVAVALYVRFNDERLAYTLRDSEATFAMVENEEQFGRVLGAIRENRESQGAIRINRFVSFEAVSRRTTPAGVEVRSLAELLESPMVMDPSELPYVEGKRDELATIYYTSGSSGLPTGVPVTHGQTLENLYQIAASGLIDYKKYEQPDAPQPFVTLILPERAHAFPARNAQLSATSPARARYPAILDRNASTVDAAYRESLRQDLREGAAGIVPIVPKVLVAIEQRVRERLEHGGRKEKIARRVVENAAARLLDESARRHGPKVAARDLLYRTLAPLRRRVAAEIRQQVVGPDFEFFISGGAKLPLQTAAFLWAIDLPVFEGYGSTESNCPIAVNTPGNCKLGSVGKLFPNVEAKTDMTTGELLLRGPNVVDRYWKQDGKSQAVWSADGWYRTRDIGRVDKEGFLFIDDRVDNVLVAWNGENVSAAAIESRFVAIPFVDTAIVIGHQRPALMALVCINDETVQRWRERLGRSARSGDDDSELLQLLREQIQLHVNSKAGHACESIRNVAVIEPLACESQTMTATEKVRRKEIERIYADKIERLYQDRSQWLPVLARRGGSEAISPGDRRYPNNDVSAGSNHAASEPSHQLDEELRERS